MKGWNREVEKQQNAQDQEVLLRLQRSEERYRALTMAMSQAVWTADTNGMGKESTEWWSEITGQRPDQVSPWGWLEALHPEDREPARNAWQHSLATNTPYETIYRIRTRTGDYRTFLVRGIPLKNEDDTLREWVGTLTDITESQRREAELERSRKQYANLVNMVDGIVWEADPETFQISFVSPYAEKMLGYPVSEWTEQADFFVKHIYPADVEETLSQCRIAIAALRDHALEYRMVAADGRLVWIHDVTHLHVENGRATRLYGLLIDITEQKRLQSALLHAQKMESIGRLAGGVAHDFNNMLTAIQGYAELAMDSLPAGAPEKSYLAQVQIAAERSASLTSQLLAFARKQAISPQIVDMNEIIRRAVGLLRPLIGENIQIDMRLEASPSLVFLDTGQFEQVLINLIVNARDAMSQGGILSISTSNGVLPVSTTPSLTVTAPQPCVFLTVRDSGVGMDERTMSQIFEPFFTTKEIGKGTGLGLATCQGIVEQNGGTIQVTSSPGEGTTFTLSFPLSNPVNSAQKRAAR